MAAITIVSGGAVWWTLTRWRQVWCVCNVKTVWSIPERFRGELLTMGRYRNLSSCTFSVLYACILALYYVDKYTGVILDPYIEHMCSKYHHSFVNNVWSSSCSVLILTWFHLQFLLMTWQFYVNTSSQNLYPFFVFWRRWPSSCYRCVSQYRHHIWPNLKVKTHF